MIKKSIFLFYFLIINILCFSQQERKISKTDSLLNLSDSYINKDFKKTLFYAEQALLEAQKENSSKGRAQAYFYAAKSLLFYRQIEKSSYYLEKGLKESALKEDILLKANYNILQATYYSKISLFEQ